MVTAFVCAAALSAQAGYWVELESGESFAVDSFWREGSQVHLVRGGMDMIVDGSRIRRLEEGDAPAKAPKRESVREASATKKDEGTVSATQDVPPPAPAKWRPPAAYREATVETVRDGRRLDELTSDELGQENYRASKRLVRALQERSEAKFRDDLTPSQRQRIEDRFWRNKKVERIIEAQHERRLAQDAGVVLD